jgi:hypothetical protein
MWALDANRTRSDLTLDGGFLIGAAERWLVSAL